MMTEIVNSKTPVLQPLFLKLKSDIAMERVKCTFKDSEDGLRPKTVRSLLEDNGVLVTASVDGYSDVALLAEENSMGVFFVDVQFTKEGYEGYTLTQAVSCNILNITAEAIKRAIDSIFECTEYYVDIKPW